MKRVFSMHHYAVMKHMLDCKSTHWRHGSSANHQYLLGASAFTTRAGYCYSSGLAVNQMMSSKMKWLSQSQSFTNYTVLLTSFCPHSNLATMMTAQRKSTYLRGNQIWTHGSTLIHVRFL